MALERGGASLYVRIESKTLDAVEKCRDITIVEDLPTCMRNKDFVFESEL